MCTPSAPIASCRDTKDEDTVTSSLSGTKRVRPETSVSDSDEELKRIRYKNRTNSKRFRDRKKNYMDGLFEQKYRLGKANDALRDDNDKLRRRLEEAILENQAHKRNSALGLYNVVQTSCIHPPTSPANLQQAALAGIPISHQFAPIARHDNTTSLVDVDQKKLQYPNAPRIETELVTLQQGQPGSTPNVWVLITRAVPDALGAYKREHMLQETQDMRLRDLGASVASNILTSRPKVVVCPPSC